MRIGVGSPAGRGGEPASACPVVSSVCQAREGGT
jgi:hypothetical protein